MNVASTSCMDALEVGTTLMRKYRLDCYVGELGGAAVYEGTDVVHGRHVCVKLCPHDLTAEVIAEGATVVDIGALHGETYIVTADEAARFPAPREPAHIESVTRTLPGLGTAPRLEIVPTPTLEDAFFESEPIPEYEYEEPALPLKKRRWPWVAFPLVAALSGLAGWYHAHTHEPPLVSETTVTAARVPTQVVVAPLAIASPTTTASSEPPKAAPPPQTTPVVKHSKARPVHRSAPVPTDGAPLTL